MNDSLKEAIEKIKKKVLQEGFISTSAEENLEFEETLNS